MNPTNRSRLVLCAAGIVVLGGLLLNMSLRSRVPAESVSHPEQVKSPGKGVAKPVEDLKANPRVADRDPVETDFTTQLKLTPLESSPEEIVGRAVNHRDEPVGGLDVIAREETPFGETLVLTTHTDEAGDFRFDVAAGRVYEIWAEQSEVPVSAPERACGGDSLTLRVTTTEQLEVRVIQVVSFPDAEQAGEQESAVGQQVLEALAQSETQPVAGARVVLSFESGKELEAVTSNDGVVAFPRPPSGTRISALASGYSASGLGYDGQSPTVTLVLELGAVVQGVVVDAVDGHGIGAARVSSSLGSTVSDREGRFSFEDGIRPNDRLTILAEVSGYAPGFGYARTGTVPAVCDVRIALHPSIHVDGYVKDQGGAPVAGAEVFYSALVGEIPFTGEYARAVSSTDEAGHFELAQIALGTSYRLDVKEGGRQASVLAGPFALADNGTRLPTITLDGPFLLRGLVVDAPKNSRCRLSIQALSDAAGKSGRVLDPKAHPVLTDRNGEFTVRHLARGLYAIRLLGLESELEQDEEEGSCAEIVAIGDVPEVFVELRFNPGSDGVLRGVVRTPAGDPAGRVRVTLTDRREAMLAEVLTDGDGRFQFRGVQLEDAGHLRAVDLSDNYAPAETDIEGDREVVLMLGSYDLSLEGYLRTRMGAPVSDAFVSCIIESSGQRIGRVGIPDEDGYFALHNLAPGPYRLELTDFEGHYVPAHLSNVQANQGLIEFLIDPADF